MEEGPPPVIADEGHGHARGPLDLAHATKAHAEPVQLALDPLAQQVLANAPDQRAVPGELGDVRGEDGPVPADVGLDRDVHRAKVAPLREVLLGLHHEVYDDITDREDLGHANTEHGMDI